VSAIDTQLESVRAAVEPAVVGLGLAVYDVELLGGAGARTLRLTVTRPSGSANSDERGVDLETITEVTRAVSPIVDPIMDSAAASIGGSYLLEVSSPGVERALRRPEHFREALGEEVSVKFHTDAGPRRVRGVLRAFDGDHCVIESDDGDDEEIAITAITQARTVFEWGPQPRQGSKTRSRARAKGKS
jgi:ribosome maturation factor RimP